MRYSKHVVCGIAALVMSGCNEDPGGSAATPEGCDPAEFTQVVTVLDDQLGVSGALSRIQTDYADDTTVLCLHDGSTIWLFCADGAIQWQLNPLSCSAIEQLAAQRR